MTPVDQKLARVKQLLADQPAVFARQGAVIATWRTVGDRRVGPYFSLRYRDGRRQRSLYLGSSTVLADTVQQLLHGCQRECQNLRALHRMRAAVKASLRAHMKLWRDQIKQVGLTLKGFEVRGWKHFKATSSPRAAPNDLTGARRLGYFHRRQPRAAMASATSAKC